MQRQSKNDNFVVAAGIFPLKPKQIELIQLKPKTESTQGIYPESSSIYRPHLPYRKQQALTQTATTSSVYNVYPGFTKTLMAAFKNKSERWISTMNLRLVLTAAITLVLTVQSAAHHLSALNPEGRYASVIQSEHQRWLDGENPDGEFQHHQDFVNMFVVLNNCLVNNSYIRECYKDLGEQYTNCWLHRTETMGQGMAVRSCYLDRYRVYDSVLNFELRTFYESPKHSNNPEIIEDMKSSQNAWETLRTLDCSKLMRSLDPSPQHFLYLTCPEGYYEDRIATVYSYNMGDLD